MGSTNTELTLSRSFSCRLSYPPRAPRRSHAASTWGLMSLFLENKFSTIPKPGPRRRKEVEEEANNTRCLSMMGRGGHVLTHAISQLLLLLLTGACVAAAAQAADARASKQSQARGNRRRDSQVPVLEVQGCNSNPVRTAIACLILSKPPDLLSCLSAGCVSRNPGWPAQTMSSSWQLTCARAAQVARNGRRYCSHRYTQHGGWFAGRCCRPVCGVV